MKSQGEVVSFSVSVRVHVCVRVCVSVCEHQRASMLPPAVTDLSGTKATLTQKPTSVLAVSLYVNQPACQVGFFSFFS